MGLGKLNRLHKVLLVLGSGIILPAIFLAYLGFRQVLAQPRISRALLDELVESKAELIESGREANFAAIAESVRGATATEIIPELQRLESRNRIVHTFLMDPTKGILYPDPSVAKSERTDEGTGLLSEWSTNRIIRMAIVLESTGQDLRQAAALYNRALGSASSTAVRAELLRMLAVAYAKLGEFKEAAEGAAQAAELIDSTQGRSWDWAVVSLNYADWAARAGLGDRAAARLVSLYSDVIRSKDPFGIGPRTELYKEKVLALLGELEKRGPLPAPTAEFYETLKRDEVRVEYDRRLISDLKILLIPKVSLAEKPLTNDIRVTYDYIDGEAVEIVYWGIQSTQPDQPLVAGFWLDLPMLSHVVSNRMLPRAVTETEPLISLVDARGNFLGGEIPSGPGEPLASARMTKLLPGWEVRAYERVPGQFAAAARRHLLLYAALLVLVTAAISASVVITARSLVREVELGRLKSEFVSGVSHELKTPLSLIKLYNDTLSMNRIASPEKKLDYHNVVARECDRLTGFIDRVLDFSRIEVGRRKYNLRETDLASVVESAIDTCQPEAEAQGTQLIAHGLSERLIVRADPEGLRQALENLIDNAVKYSPSNSVVDVKLESDGRSTVVSVADRGIGIAPAEQKRVFDEFYRGTRPEVIRVRGSGLGLALVKHTVRAHGGTVRLQSEVGKGSTFSISLPLVKETSSLEKPRPTKSPARRG